MISPILIATQGRIGKTNSRTLTLATIGRIRRVEIIIIKDGETTYEEIEYHAPGGGGYSKGKNPYADYANKQYTDLQKRIKRIKEDDNEILLIIKIFLECQ